jgi:peptidoglycan/LPS O-acetylase OafA/YrhL/glycosyltransferase involved in cell wall biosynthesis
MWLYKPDGGLRQQHVTGGGHGLEHLWVAIRTLPGTFVFELSPLHFLAAGHEAVVLFFILSGFVLYLPWKRNDPPPYGRFVLKRLCRIYLPYLASLMLVIFLNAAISQGGLPEMNEWFNKTWPIPVTWGPIVRHVVLLDSFDTAQFSPPFWSLVHEMRISLVFPLVAMLVFYWPRRAAAVAAMLSFAGIVLTAVGPANNYFITLHYTACFVAGCLMAQYRERTCIFYAELSHRKRVLLMIIAFFLYTYGRAVTWLHGVPDAMGDIVIGTGAVLIILWAQSNPRILQLTVAKWLGKISYGLYLTHFGVIFACIYLWHRNMPLWLILSLSIPLSLVVAETFYRIVEAPSILLGRRLGSAPPRTAAPALAVRSREHELSQVMGRGTPDRLQSMDRIRKSVLVVGQTPPPINGQNVMIQELLDGDYAEVALHHVRLTFSRSIDEVGAFQIRKLLVLLKTLLDIIVGRLQSGAQILYYPPAGPTLNPVLRDIFLLISTRWLFRYTVFHFHAAGLPEIYPRLPGWLKPLFNLAYRNVDLAIFTTEATAAGGSALGAKEIIVVPYGIPDSAEEHVTNSSNEKNIVPQILFMGLLCEGKGLLVLIEACAQVRRAGLLFHLSCVGAFESEHFRKQVEELIESRGLTGIVDFPGVLSGEAKIQAYRNADLFCLPSHYFAESFGVVLIEAMSFGLPIVTTNWRGIPDVVGGSGGAFIVEPQMPHLVAEGLRTLIRDFELRTIMGRRNRAWFANHYTLEKYRARMEKAFQEVGSREQLQVNSLTSDLSPS